MLKSIKIKNMRLFESLEIDEFKRFNLLVGNANTGKTTLLENVFLLLGPLNPKLIININRFRGLDTVDDNYWANYFHRLGIEEEILIAGEFGGDSVERRELRFSPVMASSLRGASTKNGLGVDVDDASTAADRTVGLDFNYVRCPIRGKPEHFKTRVVEEEKGMPEFEYKKGHEKQTRPGVFVTPTTQHLNLSQRFAKLAIGKEKKELLAVLSKVEPEIKDLEIGPNNVLYCDVGFPNMLPINLMGGGIIKILSVLVAFATCRGGVLLVDEIENGLHYSAQKVLWEAVYDAASRFDVQVIASTHSYECAVAFNVLAKERLDLLDEFSLMRLEKHGGSSHIVSIDMDALDAAIDSNWEVR